MTPTLNAPVAALSSSLKILATILLLATAPVCAAAEPELLARSGPVSGFLMPGNSAIAGNTPSINDSGIAALRISALGATSERAVWTGDGGFGEVVATASADWFITDASINNAGEIAWAQTDSPANGIYGWNPETGEVGLITAEPLGTASWGTVRISDAASLGFRATFGAGGRAWVSRAAGGGTAIHAAEAAIQPGSPWSFLFTPAFNQQRRIGGKVLLIGGGNQLIRTDPNGAFVVLASDQAADAASPFASLDNSPAMNDFGEFGFIANLAEGGRGVFFTDGQTTLELAREGRDGVGTIEFFGPAVDNQGRVVFRAFEDGGRRAIWLAGESGVQRLIGAGDLVETDLGTARIDSPAGIEFSGNPVINQSGEVAFVAVVTAPDNVDDVFGLGLFRQAFAAEVIFADGFESP